MKKRYGITIPEVLVSMIILGIMFLMVLGVIILIKRNYLDEEKRSAMQQNASVILAKLTRELMESSYNTATIYNPSSTNVPAGIIFASPRDPLLNNKVDLDTSTGSCRWHKYICYYIDTDPENPNEKALFRKEKDISGGTLNKVPSSDSTMDFKNNPDLYRTIIAHRVNDLNFPELGIGNFSPNQIGQKLPLKIDIILSEKANVPSEKNSITLTFSVNMHN